MLIKTPLSTTEKYPHFANGIQLSIPTFDVVKISKTLHKKVGRITFVVVFQIFEVQPGGLSDLPNGTRVCAYWSEKYHHLFPGTIAEDLHHSRSPKDKNYVNIELDDGDDREVHIRNIRFLPPDYPIVSKYKPTDLRNTYYDNIYKFFNLTEQK